MRAAPLTCFRKSGEPYTRHEAVEDEIARALGMSHTVWCDQPWRIETLVHLIRLRLRDNDPHVLGVLTYQFLERVKPIVDRWSRGYGTADSEEIQITVADELGDLLNEASPSRTAEYLEIDAATIVKQATLRAIGPDRPKAREFQSADRDEDGQYTQTVDRVASEAPDPSAVSKSVILASWPPNRPAYRPKDCKEQSSLATIRPPNAQQKPPPSRFPN